MIDYDVIVVGCGPSGLMACGELAKRGVKVLGIDKKPQLDKNLRTVSGYCFLDQPFNNEVIRTEPNGSKTKLHYSECGFTVEYPDSMEGVYHTYMVADSGTYWKASTTKKPLYHLFDADKCFSARFGWAHKKGVDFLTETLVHKVAQDKNSVTVTARTRGKDSKITCRKLIAADGLNSRIARLTGANAGRQFFAKGPTMEYEMAGVECPFDRGDMLFFGKKNFGGMQGALLMLPSPHTNDSFRLETISMLPASNGEKLLEYFTREGPYAHWFKNAEIIDKSGAIVDLISPMITPYKGNILFVGDSAAFGECLYQSATMAGYMGAVCTLKELDGKKGFEEYTRFWGDYFEWVKNSKRMADYLKRTMFTRYFSIREIDFLFNLSRKYPIVMEQAEATPYDYAAMLLQSFQAMDEVPQEMKDQMQMIIDADMATISSVIGKNQEA